MSELIICDIQIHGKEYWRGMFNLSEIIRYMEEFDHTLIFFNGEDLEMDTLEGMKDFYIDHGMTDELEEKTWFVEKSYGFFRDLIDQDWCNDDIIKLYHEMQKQSVTDSRDLDLEALPENFQEELAGGRLAIFEPVWNIDSEFIVKYFNPCTLIGGSQVACLREIELFFQAHNVEYIKNQRFIF